MILNDFVRSEQVVVEPTAYFDELTQTIDASGMPCTTSCRLSWGSCCSSGRPASASGCADCGRDCHGSRAGLAAFWLTYHTMRESVHDLRDVAAQLAAGDLTVQAKVGGKDELSEIARSFNALAAHWRSLIGDINGAVGVQSSSVTMAQSSGSIARSSQEQSESAASMAAAVEQMSVSVAQVADNTRETTGGQQHPESGCRGAADRAGCRARNAAGQAQAVTDTAHTINAALNASSTQISKSWV